MKIAFFDSGIGGLTVLKEARIAYPSAHYLYFADTDNVPYGTKSKKEIYRLVDEAVSFLAEKNIDLLVLACNTATSVAVKKLRSKYNFPIVGMEPAIKPATEIKNQKKILVCATKLTLKEKKLKDLISDLKAEDKVKLMSLQKLVKFAENENFKSKKLEEYLRKKLIKINWDNYKAIVLGCTHFLFFRNQIAKLLPDHIEIIDGNHGTVNRMLQLLPADNKSIKTKISFYRSMKKAKAKDFQVFLDYYSPT